jgi:hypothetical protein
MKPVILRAIWTQIWIWIFNSHAHHWNFRRSRVSSWYLISRVRLYHSPFRIYPEFSSIYMVVSIYIPWRSHSSSNEYVSLSALVSGICLFSGVVKSYSYSDNLLFYWEYLYTFIVFWEYLMDSKGWAIFFRFCPWLFLHIFSYLYLLST